MSAEKVEIVPYQDGPYLVRGPVTLRDQDGQRIDPGRRTIALCRCGKSKIRPFCDGTHQLIRFKVPSGPQQERPSGSEERPAAVPSPAIPRPALPPNGSSHPELAESCAAPEGADEPIGRALSLLAAARVLVERSAAGQPEDWEIPCICLVRGAIAELAGVPGNGEREISKVIDQLAVIVTLLELPGGLG